MRNLIQMMRNIGNVVRIAGLFFTNPIFLGALTGIGLLIFIILIFMSFFQNVTGSPGGTTGIDGLILTLSAPDNIDNGEIILYTIKATYSGPHELEVYNPLPPNATFIKASGTYKMVENTLVWILKENLVNSESGNFKEYIFTYTVNPSSNDIVVTNQAYARVKKLGVPNNPPPGAPGTSESTQNVLDTCRGKYNLTLTPLKINFGDPRCNFTPNDLYLRLQQQDPSNAAKWYRMAACESSYNPNAFNNPAASQNAPPDKAGAWGLFQMGRGKNGPYDHGDVEWPQQIFNAIFYNRSMLQGRFNYWHCQ